MRLEKVGPTSGAGARVASRFHCAMAWPANVQAGLENEVNCRRALHHRDYGVVLGEWRRRARFHVAGFRNVSTFEPAT